MCVVLFLLVLFSLLSVASLACLLFVVVVIYLNSSGCAEHWETLLASNEHLKIKSGFSTSVLQYFNP